jgi:hypothetical protein
MKINRADSIFIFFVLVAGWTLTGCQKLAGTAPAERAVEITSEVNSVINTTPVDFTTGVPLNAQIKVDFYAPVDVNSLTSGDGGFRFQVLDDNGFATEGHLTFENGNKRVVFNRTIGGVPASLDAGTSYLVKTNFIRDEFGSIIGPFSFHFRTQEYSNQTTGRFFVADVLPRGQWPFIMPNTPITVEFSEPIYPYQQDTCDNNPIWQNVLQVKNYAPFNHGNYSSIQGMPGQICVACAYPGFCNRLVFNPSQNYADLSEISIEVWRVQAFRGFSGEQLNQEHFVTFKTVLFNSW